MIYGSVCSGIEAATVAWHPLGWRAAWYAEIERFPSAVLAHHYPEVPNYGDFTALLSPGHERANVDVLVGGTPCQAFSVAGLRGGLSDPRGNLAMAFVALVGSLRPKWVVWENVPGVLSVDGGRAFGSFLGGLAELGYGWAYRVLDAQYFGLAQRRQRVFVVASPGDWRGPAAVLFEPESVRWDSPPRRQAGAGVAGSVGTGASGGGGWRVGADEAAAGHAIPVDLQNARIGGDVVGTLDCSRPGRGGGQAVMAFGGNNPNALDVATACNAKGGAGRMDFESETFIAHTLRAEGHDASEDGTGRGVPLVPCETFQNTGHGYWNESPVGATVRTPKGGGSLEANVTITPRVGVRRLMPHELERLQGFPDHYTLLPDCQRKAVEDDYAVWFSERFPRMTRDEIERLAKDGPRAKALGNSMAVPVMRWIGQRIAKVGAA